MEWVSNYFTKHAIASAQLVTTFVSHLWVDHNKQTKEGLTTGDVSDVENPRSLLLAEAVVLNVNQTEMGVSDNTTLVHQTHVGVSDTTSLLHQTPVIAQATSSFDIENPRSFTQHEVTTNGSAAIRDQPGVDMSATASILPQTPIVAEATRSFHIQDPENLPREVVSNGNAHEVRDETGIDMSDTASLLSQTPTAQATSSSQIQNSSNFPREGGQNSSGVANAGSGMASQHSKQPPSPVEGHNNDIIQAVITDAKEVVNRVTVVSLGCLLAAVAAVKGKETAHLKDNLFFTALVLLNFALLALGFGLHRFINQNPESTPGFVKIVKFTNNLSQILLFYTGGCGICILFPSVVVVVVILIFPPIGIGFVAILGYARRGQRPS